MASYTPGISYTIGTETEIGAELIGPVRVFHDLGKNNGDLIRSGNATVARFAAFIAAPYTDPAGNYVADGDLHAAKANYMMAFAFAASEGVISTVSGAGGSVPDNLAGLICHAGYTNNSTYGVPIMSGANVAANTSLGASSVASSDFVFDSFGLFRIGANYGSRMVFELSVTGTNTLRLAVHGNLASNVASTLKKDIDSRARNALAEVTRSLTITTTTLTAKQYLATFPYFMIQWPCATHALSLMHCRGFVA